MWFCVKNSIILNTYLPFAHTSTASKLNLSSVIGSGDG